jgi:multiple sugar transport system substrate-binding protein
MTGSPAGSRRTRARRRRLALALVGALLVPLAAACGSDEGGAPTINLYYSTEEHLPKVVAECNQAAAGRYRIKYNVLPRDADSQRVQMVRRLAAKDSGMDVLGLDVTWTQEFASAKWIREWTGDNAAQAEADTLAGPLETAKYEDKLYAAPKNTNVQLLWYRSDVVQNPPTTWAEMMQQSRQLQQQGKPFRIITMGAQYEGLVVLYNNLVASAGGHILNDEGTKADFDQGAVQALQVLQQYASSGLTSPSFTNLIEDPARLEFQAGGGAFELNWPFVYPAIQEAAPDMAKNVKWARYPGVNAGTPSKVTIGGFNLAVSSYSKHPDLAYDAALCIRNAAHQKYQAINDGIPPTIRTIYDDPEMLKAYPMKDDILAELQDPAVRPLTPAYQNVSTVLSATLSPPQSIRPEKTADELRSSIQDALESKGVLP